MGVANYIMLPERGVIGIGGPDARGFLQGLISNDVTKVAADRAIYAALLTPQGKFLHDFFIAEHDGGLLLDCEAARAEDLLRRLGMYKLRSKVELQPQNDAFAVAVLIGDQAANAFGLAAACGRAAAFAGGLVYVDPRLVALGLRAILPRATAITSLEAAGLAASEPAEYHRLRLSLGVPDGSHDLAVEKALLLESNFEELNGVDFGKGCYMGQELTARTKYRGLVRKRLLPVDVDGPLPPPDTPVMLEGKEAGIMRSGFDGKALALLRLEEIEQAARSGKALTAGDARLTPSKPGWAKF